MKNQIPLPKTPAPKVGDKIYVPSAWHISRGSDDVAGGEATISEVSHGISGGEPVWFVDVKEVPGHGYNWCQILKPQQEELKEEYEGKTAHPQPDIDTPWIEPGDIVDGHKYTGEPVW